MSPMISTAELVPSPNAPAARNRGIGVMFLAFFGGWWLYLGATTLGAPALVLAAVALAGAALCFAGWRQSRHGGAPEEPAVRDRRSAAFRTINLVQWGAIIALIVVLNAVHQVAWITPGIMLIVGLHFFPLARLFRRREHALIGAALCAVALCYPVLLGPGSAAGPLATGLILWGAALGWALRR